LDLASPVKVHIVTIIMAPRLAPCLFARSPSSEAIALMQTCCAWVQVLGTYPAATTVVEPD